MTPAAGTRTAGSRRTGSASADRIYLVFPTDYSCSVGAGDQYACHRTSRLLKGSHDEHLQVPLAAVTLTAALAATATAVAEECPYWATLCRSYESTLKHVDTDQDGIDDTYVCKKCVADKNLRQTTSQPVVGAPKTERTSGSAKNCSKRYQRSYQGDPEDFDAADCAGTWQPNGSCGDESSGLALVCVEDSHQFPS